MLSTYASPAGRIILGAFFLMAGISKLTGDIAGLAAYIESGGLPGILAWPTIIFEIAVGLALIAGFQTRIAALAAAAFCVATAALYHNNFADQLQMTMFVKNIALAGAYLFVAGMGPGRLAVDKA
jgi:putative oxidoreductase